MQISKSDYMLYLRQPAWLWVKKHDPGPIPPIDMTTELQVLKDADALDRTRLGDLDTRYLRTEAAVSLVDLAEELFDTYETIESDSTFDAVVRSAQTIQVVDIPSKG